MAYELRYGTAAWRSHRPWTLLFRFFAWAARAAYREKFGNDVPVTDDPDDAPADVHVYIDDGVGGEEAVPAQPGTRQGSVQAGPHGNQKDDYLHRAEPGSGSILLGMGIYHYTECVSRVMLPPNKERDQLRHPYYPFAEHYLVGSLHCQKWDYVAGVPRVPVLEGVTIPSPSRDPQMNALCKSALLRPMLCPGACVGGGCPKVDAFRRLCDRTGWRGPFARWLAVQKRRAARADAYCETNELYPSHVAFGAPALRCPDCGPAEHVCRARAAAFRWRFAQVSVEVSENLDFIAEAKHRPKRRQDMTLVRDDAADPWGGAAENIQNARAREGGLVPDFGGAEDCEAPDARGQPRPVRPQWPMREEMLPLLTRFAEGTLTHDAREEMARRSDRERRSPPAPPRPPVQVARARGLCFSSTTGATYPEMLAKQEKERQRLQAARDARMSGAAGGAAGEAAPSGDASVRVQQPADPADAAWVVVHLAGEAWVAVQAAGCTEGQTDVCALVVDALVRRARGENVQVVINVQGEGGVGKTYALGAVLRPLVCKRFGGRAERAVAVQNSAVRVLGGDATTYHQVTGARRGVKMTEGTVTGEQRRRDLEADFLHCMLLCADEVSMVPAVLQYFLHAAAVAARRGDDDEREVPYGGIPAVVLTGDHMQLPPVAKTGLTDRSGAPGSLEIAEGWRVYEAATHTVVLTENKRFEDEWLPALLCAMRAGSRIPDAVWQEFRKCFDGAPEWQDEDGCDRRAALPEWQDAGLGAITWEAVAREQQDAARRGARAAGTLVQYAQACDMAKGGMSREEAVNALQVVSMTKTAKLMGLLPLFVGMRVRVTHKIERAANVVQEATGIVVGIQHNEAEDVWWERDDLATEVLDRGVLLTYLPDAVFVALDEHVPRPEDGFAGTAFMAGAPRGVFAFEPVQERTDAVRIGEMRAERSWLRSQFPLAPEGPKTINNWQGMTARYFVGDVTRPYWLKGKDDEYWAYLYVMLSRPRQLARLRVLGVTAARAFRRFLERGPGAPVRRELARLALLAERSAPDIAAARERLGWPQRAGVGEPAADEPGRADAPADPANAPGGAPPGDAGDVPVGDAQSALRVLARCRLENRGNSCYLNAVVHVLRADAVVCAAFANHACALGERMCLPCALRVDLRPVALAQRVIAVAYPALANRRALLEGPGTARFSAEGHEDMAEALDRVLHVASADGALAQCLQGQLGVVLEERTACTCGARGAWVAALAFGASVQPWGPEEALADALPRPRDPQQGVCAACGADALPAEARYARLPPTLLVRVGRYGWAGGAAYKSHDDAVLPAALELPEWGAAGPGPVGYALHSCAVHLGPTPREGHYVVQQNLDYPEPPTSWATDDGTRRYPSGDEYDRITSAVLAVYGRRDE